MATWHADGELRLVLVVDSTSTAADDTCAKGTDGHHAPHTPGDHLIDRRKTHFCFLLPGLRRAA